MKITLVCEIISFGNQFSHVIQDFTYTLKSKKPEYEMPMEQHGALSADKIFYYKVYKKQNKLLMQHIKRTI